MNIYLYSRVPIIRTPINRNIHLSEHSIFLSLSYYFPLILFNFLSHSFSLTLILSFSITFSLSYSLSFSLTHILSFLIVLTFYIVVFFSPREILYISVHQRMEQQENKNLGKVVKNCQDNRIHVYLTIPPPSFRRELSLFLFASELSIRSHISLKSWLLYSRSITVSFITFRCKSDVWETKMIVFPLNEKEKVCSENNLGL